MSITEKIKYGMILLTKGLDGIITIACIVINAALAKMEQGTCTKVGGCVTSIGTCLKEIGELCASAVWKAFWVALAQIPVDVGKALVDANVEEVEADVICKDVSAAWAAYKSAK